MLTGSSERSASADSRTRPGPGNTREVESRCALGCRPSRKVRGALESGGDAPGESTGAGRSLPLAGNLAVHWQTPRVPKAEASPPTAAGANLQLGLGAAAQAPSGPGPGPRADRDSEVPQAALGAGASCSKPGAAATNAASACVGLGATSESKPPRLVCASLNGPTAAVSRACVSLRA
jgi:hypothetical protein